MSVCYLSINDMRSGAVSVADLVDPTLSPILNRDAWTLFSSIWVAVKARSMPHS